MIDIPFFIYGVFRKKLKTDSKPFNKRASFAITALSTLLLSANLFLAEVNRGELLTRGFSNNYIVRAMGIPFFTAYSGNLTYQASQARSSATSDDMKKVEAYVKEHYAAPDPKYYGIAKGRNVIVIHLESFQQFLIDYKLQVDGQSYEVTPFLNSIYHSNETLAFSNFFHQVKSGKTSDAETLMETSLFGLSTGSYMVNYGGTNTAYAAPSILQLFSTETLDPSGIAIIPIKSGVITTSLTHQLSLRKPMKTPSNTVLMISTCFQIPSNIWNKCNSLSMLNT